MLTGKVIRETAKAILFKAIGSWKGDCWWPKSQVEILADSEFDYLRVPDWLLCKKIDNGELYC